MDSELENGKAAALPSPGGLSFQNGNWYLMAKTGSLGQQHLAELVGVDPRNAVPIIDGLAAHGLVHREVDPVDRRRRVLDLTARGREVVGELASVGAEIERDLLSPLTPAEQATLRHMLRALLSAGQESG